MVSDSTIQSYLMRIDETLPTTSQFYGNASYDSNVAIGTVDHYPFYANLLGLTTKYTASYGLTQMPIPTQNTPFLLNFTGPSLAISLNWESVQMLDVAFMLEFFTTANPSAKIVYDVTNVWGASSSTNNIITEKYNFNNQILGSGYMRFNGVVNEFTVEEDAGAIKWRYSMTIFIGEVLG